MSQFYFQPILDSFAVVIVIALVLFALLLVGPAFQNVARNRRTALLGVRLVVILFLLVAMLRPTCVHTSTKRQTATLLVLFDKSRSMQLPSAADDKSRWQAQREALEYVQPLLDDLGRELELKVYAYDSQLHPVEIDEGKIKFPDAPDGSQTDVGTPLHDALRRELGKRLAGVVLLGDGVQTAFDPQVEMLEVGREMARLEHPLYAVAFGPVGDAVQARDVAVENLPDEYAVFVKNELGVRASLRVRGYVNKDIPVELLVESATGETERIGPLKLQAREDGRQVDVEMTYVPQRPGKYTLTVRAAEQPGELVTKNNELSAFLTVLEGGLRVLYLEGELRLEQKFLRRSIDASQDIELDFLWIDHRNRDRWPLDLTGMLGDPQYDVFILGDLDSSALHKKAEQEENLRALVDAVDKGKGLIMLGGFHSFGPGGYQHTPLANVLPVVMGRFERQDFGTAVSRDLHVDGPLQMLPARPHFLTHLAPGDENQQVWRSLAPLSGANKFVELKDRSRVLADAGDVPLLVSGEFGGGRVLAFAGDSTWRWWMQGRQAEHKRFWRQVVLWLARRDGLTKDDVWLKLSQRRHNPGSRVEFMAGAKTAGGDVIRDASFSAEIVLPSGVRQSLRLSRDGDVMSGSFDGTKQPGQYTIEVTARRGGQILGTAQAKFMVFDHDVELSNPAANPDQLARLANLTKQAGGRAVAPEQLPALLRQIQQRPPDLEIEVENKWQLADTPADAWPFFLVVVTLLGAEWALRKKWGLM